MNLAVFQFVSFAVRLTGSFLWGKDRNELVVAAWWERNDGGL